MRVGNSPARAVEVCDARSSAGQAPSFVGAPTPFHTSAKVHQNLTNCSITTADRVKWAATGGVPEAGKVLPTQILLKKKAGRLFPSESKLGSNRGHCIAVQHLGGASEDGRLLNPDVVRIKLSEAQCFGKQLPRVVRTQAARLNPG